MNPKRPFDATVSFAGVAIVALLVASAIAETPAPGGAGTGSGDSLDAGRILGTVLLAAIAIAALVRSRVVGSLPPWADRLPIGEGRGLETDLREHQECSRWLVRTRWLAVAAVATAVALGAFVVPVVHAGCAWPLTLTTVVLAGTNLVFRHLARGGERPAAVLQAQMVSDLLLLSILLHYSGGVENPLMVLYLAHVVLAGLLLPRPVAYRIAVLAAILAIYGPALEAARALPHHDLDLLPHPPGPQGPDFPAYDTGYVGGVTGSLVLLMAVFSWLTTSVRKRLKVCEAEMVSANKMSSLGRLSAGLAHEINNPLGIALTRTKLLLEGDGRPRGDGALAADLRTVDRALERVAGIVRGVLAYSRSAPGRLEALDLGRAVRDALAAAQAPRGFAPAAVDLKLPAEPILVPGNEGEISQLVSNLVANALEASPEGSPVLVGVEREGDSALLWVEDRGPGIPPEVRDRVFEPFFTTKADRGGTGLGLAIVHGVVLSHGGRIRFGKAPGGGTRFEVRLPIAASAAEAVTP